MWYRFASRIDALLVEAVGMLSFIDESHSFATLRVKSSAVSNHNTAFLNLK